MANSQPLSRLFKWLYPPYIPLGSHYKKLFFLVKPTITKPLKESYTEVENHELKLSVDIQANPEPDVTWYHNGEQVDADARIKIKREGTETWSLTFNVLLPSDSGDWTVKSKNEAGEAESKTVVIVEGMLLNYFNIFTAAFQKSCFNLHVCLQANLNSKRNWLKLWNVSNPIASPLKSKSEEYLHPSFSGMFTSPPFFHCRGLQSDL